LVASYDPWPEKERVYSQRKRQVRKKGKWGSIQCKQADEIHIGPKSTN